MDQRAKALKAADQAGENSPYRSFYFLFKARTFPGSLGGRDAAGEE